jgi:hypothetical protein
MFDGTGSALRTSCVSRSVKPRQKSIFATAYGHQCLATARPAAMAKKADKTAL